MFSILGRGKHHVMSCVNWVYAIGWTYGLPVGHGLLAGEEEGREVHLARGEEGYDRSNSKLCMYTCHA